MRKTTADESLWRDYKRDRRNMRRLDPCAGYYSFEEYCRHVASGNFVESSLREANEKRKASNGERERTTTIGGGQ